MFLETLAGVEGSSCVIGGECGNPEALTPVRSGVRRRGREQQASNSHVAMAREHEELRNEGVLLRFFPNILGTSSGPHAGISNHCAVVVRYEDLSGELSAVSKHLLDVSIGNAGTVGPAWVEVALEILEFDRATAQSIEIVLPVAFANSHAGISGWGSARSFSCTCVFHSRAQVSFDLPHQILVIRNRLDSHRCRF